MVEQEIQNVDETNTVECNTHLTQKDFYYHGMELKVKIYSFQDNKCQTDIRLPKERSTNVGYEDLGLRVKIIDSEDEDVVPTPDVSVSKVPIPLDITEQTEQHSEHSETP